jgi:hypothetical protein
MKPGSLNMVDASSGIRNVINPLSFSRTKQNSSPLAMITGNKSRAKRAGKNDFKHFGKLVIAAAALLLVLCGFYLGSEIGSYQDNYGNLLNTITGDDPPSTILLLKKSLEKCDDHSNAINDADGTTDTPSTPLPPQIAADQSKNDIALSSSTKMKEMTWPNWPAVAYEGLFHPLVFKGDSFVHNIRNIVLAPAAGLTNSVTDGTTTTNGTAKTVLEEFIDIYKNRPDKVNMCGIRINHALALFVTVRQLQHELVVESGVNAGLSTYIIRAAAPDTEIYALDPEVEAICNQGKRWIDTSDKTTYFTGEKFVDLADHDWRAKFAEGTMDPEKTLIFIDDHLNAIERLPALIKAGIRHVVVEDNYKAFKGATQADKHGCPKQAFNAHNTRRRNASMQDGTWLFNNLVSYAEFPPLVPPIMAKDSPEPLKKEGGFMVAADDNLDIVGPILRPDLDDDDMKIFKNVAKALDLDPSMVERNSYMQFMNYNQICYLNLLPMPAHLSAKL